MVLIRLFCFTYTSFLCYRYRFSPLSCKVVDKILEGVFEKLHDSSMQKYIQSYGQSPTYFGLLAIIRGHSAKKKKLTNYNMDMQLYL
jgi:hypothetical protein